MARCTCLCTGGIFFLRHLICWLFYTSISCSISRGHQEKKIFLIPSWTVCKWKSVIYQDTSCRRGQKCLCTPDSALPGSTQGLPGLPTCGLQFCRDFQGTLVAQRDTGSTLHGVEFAACLAWFADPDHQLCTQEQLGNADLEDETWSEGPAPLNWSEDNPWVPIIPASCPSYG